MQIQPSARTYKKHLKAQAGVLASYVLDLLVENKKLCVENPSFWEDNFDLFEPSENKSDLPKHEFTLDGFAFTFVNG